MSDTEYLKARTRLGKNRLSHVQTFHQSMNELVFVSSEELGLLNLLLTAIGPRGRQCARRDSPSIIRELSMLIRDDTEGGMKHGRYLKEKI